MLTLAICVLLNSLIGVIFKFFEKYSIDNFQAIVTNYFVCVLTAAFTIKGNPIPTPVYGQVWFGYAVVLGVLFIIVFNIMALAVQKSGVMMATIFQKMSLIAPAILAIFFYGESSGLYKWMGIIMAIGAIALLSYQSESDKSVDVKTKPTKHLLFPLLTFLGSCLIDSSIFLIEKQGFVENGDIGFVASLFFFAAVSGLIFLIYNVAMGKTKIYLKNIIAGICLGIPNFYSIYFLFLALQQGIEGSVVFPVNNAGVLLLASVYGILIFKEKINFYKMAGFILAVISIFIITLA